MDTKLLTQVTSWLKETDIVEFVYHKDGNNIEIKTKEASVTGTNFECSLFSVASPAVGFYYRAAKGKTNPLKEGQKIAEGDFLGIVETSAKKIEVKAPVEGKLRIISIEDSKPVEFGQPLFFIEP
ncbi:Biotin carboxyl carrier protein [Elusimicrobium minutum Pei191]|uniref:Biotin carboxyl carrier protein n=1 Tax=Elusimicrobium minutum (strain Pei191) TaxID=445932 RepID=B2KDY6_ELUMP|nr:biotin/lipoyl-containing protein [Elusimicrobium minutum]ACC98732.1 Biotin carboxyl carrier protein [Elusimicrobium minutum Pei191]